MRALLLELPPLANGKGVREKGKREREERKEIVEERLYESVFVGQIAESVLVCLYLYRCV